ncbi:unnamed protein product [Pylaiella littoralis]
MTAPSCCFIGDCCVPNRTRDVIGQARGLGLRKVTRARRGGGGSRSSNEVFQQKPQQSAVTLNSRRRSRGVDQGCSSCSICTEVGAGVRKALKSAARFPLSVDAGFRTPEALRFGSASAGRPSCGATGTASGRNQHARLAGRAGYVPEQWQR